MKIVLTEAGEEKARQRPPLRALIVRNFDAYWTGRAWSDCRIMAREYSFNDAKAIIAHRFHRMDPTPTLMPANWLLKHARRHYWHKFGQ